MLKIYRTLFSKKDFKLVKLQLANNIKLLKINTSIVRIERVLWGFYTYASYVRFIFHNYRKLLLSLYGFGFFFGMKRLLPVFTYRRIFLNRWKKNNYIYSQRRHYVKTGAIIVRATVNNFFLTFLKNTHRGEVGAYFSAGMYERGVSKRRRSPYVAYRASGAFINRLHYKFPRLRGLFIFITRRFCLRTKTFLRILKNRGFLFLKLIVRRSTAHNGMRPPKRRRVKKLK